MSSSGRLYDGTTAYPHAVAAEAGDARLHLSAEGWSETVDAELLNAQEGTGADLRLGRSDRPGWRLVLGEPVDPAIAALVPRPSRYGVWIDRIGLARATVVLGIIAA